MSGFLWFVSVSLLGTASAEIYAPYNHKAEFRYRCFSGSRPGWVSPLTSAGGISHSGSDIITTSRGTGFSNLIVTDFDGSGEFIQGSSAVDTNDSAGHDSFAIEAWFKADTVSGWRTLFSNTESYRGFSLKINSGRLRGLMRLKDGSSSYSEEIYMDAGEPDLVAGHWYHAVFYVKEDTSADHYEMRLYVDGEQVGYRETADRWDGIYQSVEKPMIGAEPSGGSGGGNYFDGQIYAVTLSNHAIYLNNYVKTDVGRDGSRYFGTGSYHDYLDTRAAMHYRMHQTASDYPNVASKVVQRFQTPFMNDKYVPQGVAYDSANDRFYLSMHWKNTDGSTGSYPSIIVETTGAGDVRRTMQLKKSSGAQMTGHVGGLAFHNSRLYVTYGTSIYRYDLSDLPNPSYIFNPVTFANPKHDQNPLLTAASYSPGLQGNGGHSALDISADSNGDTILWSAHFDSSGYRKILGYKIDSSGNVASTATYVFNLPVLAVQGVACFSISSTDVRFYLSSSDPNPGCDLWEVRYLKSSSTAQSLTKVFYGPRGMEDLAMAGSQVWTVSESGANYYQKKSSSPWEDLFPFVYGIVP